jgi:hypothetical protein
MKDVGVKKIFMQFVRGLYTISKFAQNHRARVFRRNLLRNLGQINPDTVTREITEEEKVQVNQATLTGNTEGKFSKRNSQYFKTNLIGCHEMFSEGARPV